MRAAVQAQRLGEAGDRVLGGRVGRREGPRAVGRDGAVVDDATAARRLDLHQRKSGPCAQETAGQVGVDHGPPLRRAQFVDGQRWRRDAGVVEQQVQPAEALAQRRKRSADLRLVRDVGRQQQRLRQGFAQAGLAASEQRQRPALAGQGPRHRPADAGAGPGDQGHLHQRPIGMTRVRWTQPLKLAASTLTKPSLTSPVATSSSLRFSVATTLLSRDGAA
mmetsp:Transcript_5196/g.19338  ORF Transcript_5196/g.19338 Transcript_5196/m.19338 type:complete len:220 (-) Transcript_5196:2415-3074(-)